MQSKNYLEKIIKKQVRMFAYPFGDYNASIINIVKSQGFEGFGLVFLEAAAAGLPVIGTLGNGIEDAVKDYYNGLLVPQNDSQKTADAIIKILSDDILGLNLRKNSIEWVKNFDWKKIITSYIEIYNAYVKHN